MRGKPVIFTEKCKGCELCISSCPKEILVMSEATNKKGVNFSECIDESKCIACKMCAVTCPDNVIEIIKFK